MEGGTNNNEEKKILKDERFGQPILTMKEYVEHCLTMHMSDEELEFEQWGQRCSAERAAIDFPCKLESINKKNP